MENLEVSFFAREGVETQSRGNCSLWHEKVSTSGVLLIQVWKRNMILDFDYLFSVLVILYVWHTACN